MDPGRYILQQGWDNNSASEGYGPLPEPDFRVGGSYDGRRFLDEGFSRDNIYPRGSFHRDILERDKYPPPPSVVGAWPQQSFGEEYALIREPRRHEKPYIDGFHEVAKYREIDRFQEVNKFQDDYHGVDRYRNVDSHHDYGFDRPARFGGRDFDEFATDDYDYRHRLSCQSREDSHERGRYSYDSDYDRGSRRDGSWRKRDSRDSDRDRAMRSRERDQSPHRRHERSRSRSRSHGRDDQLRSRSRSPRSRIHGRSHREDRYDDNQHERGEKRRDRDGKRLHDHSLAAPSATVVVKGLSQKTTEEDLFQILAEWGPIRHVRVIKERNSGISRGFAFIDFPSVGDARKMIDVIGDDGLVVDGRKLVFEYSSKPTTGAGGPPYGQDNAVTSRSQKFAPPSDWMCTICSCVNFARRTSCFQCNEPRTDDAPAAEVAPSNPTQLGRKGSEAGPTHVLVVRGLDENADEEILRYEFSKHAPIKDLRLIRDKFTHVSKGFAFAHFHSVEDATKALEATNGTPLEKNGQILRVAYAKSIHGPGLGPSGASQSSSLAAAAAIEAATFAHQYDAVGWAPKEYNPDDKQSAGGQEQGSSDAGQKDGLAPQSGFVWDEASGYYYDAVSGFYYDGNTGLYYDSSNGTWYSYDQQTQQYVPCGDQNDQASGKAANEPKASDSASNRKVVISAPAATITSNEKTASLPDAVQAAATAALAAEKKEKEKMKEIRLASKSNILANKKKMSNVLSIWKQRNNVGQAARIVLDDAQSSASMDDRPKNKFRSDSMPAMESTSTSLRFSSAAVGRGASNMLTIPITAQTASVVSEIKPQPVRNSSGGTLMGVIRGSGRGIMKSDTMSGIPSTSPAVTSIAGTSTVNPETPAIQTPFRTNASALGSYTPLATSSGKRRFSEQPASSHREQPQTTYRDRAAERRSLYGSSSIGNKLADSSKHA